MRSETVTTAARQRGKNVQEKELWGRDLSRKLYHMDSLMELAEKAVAKAKKQAERITLEAEEEARRKASALIADAEERARAESIRITSEASLEAEKATREKLEEAVRKAEEIEAKAEEDASRVIAAANEKADELVKQRMTRAEEEAHDFVKQKKEQFKIAYKKLIGSLDSTNLSYISTKLSQDDIWGVTSEEGGVTAIPRKLTTFRVVIPLKFLPVFLRRRINKS
jgi:vacuolar-type H+-ATPase subunit H